MALYRGESAVSIHGLWTDEWLGYPSIPTVWVCMGVTARHSLRSLPESSRTHRVGRAPLLGRFLSSPNVLVFAPHWLLTHYLLALSPHSLAVHEAAYQRHHDPPHFPSFLPDTAKLPHLVSFKSTSSITIKTNPSTFRKLTLFERRQL